MSSHDERRPGPGLDGQPEPGSPAWDINPYAGKPYGYTHQMPKSPNATWLRKNFTAGTVITLLVLFVALVTWARTTEQMPVTNAGRIAVVERELGEVKIDLKGRVTNEMLDAKMATILEKLNGIDQRLARIERKQE